MSRLCVAALALAFGATACRGPGRLNDPSQHLREHLESESSCSSVSVDVLGQNRYAVEGCGRHAVLRCRATLAGYFASHFACQTIGRRDAWERAVGSWRAAPAGSDGTGEGAPPERVERASAPAESLSDSAPDSASDSAFDSEEGEASAPVEERARQLVHAHRETILGCAGREEQAVRARWNGSGVMRVRFHGALSESPEEQCLVRALGDLPFEAPGPGQMIELVRRSAAEPPGNSSAVPRGV